MLVQWEVIVILSRGGTGNGLWLTTFRPCALCMAGWSKYCFTFSASVGLLTCWSVSPDLSHAIITWCTNSDVIWVQELILAFTGSHNSQQTSEIKFRVWFSALKVELSAIFLSMNNFQDQHSRNSAVLSNNKVPFLSFNSLTMLSIDTESPSSDESGIALNQNQSCGILCEQ